MFTFGEIGFGAKYGHSSEKTPNDNVHLSRDSCVFWALHVLCDKTSEFGTQMPDDMSFICYLFF